jgi:hypothetical protein
MRFSYIIYSNYLWHMTIVSRNLFLKLSIRIFSYFQCVKYYYQSSWRFYKNKNLNTKQPVRYTCWVTLCLYTSAYNWVRGIHLGYYYIINQKRVLDYRKVKVDITIVTQIPRLSRDDNRGERDILLKRIYYIDRNGEGLIIIWRPAETE